MLQRSIAAAALAAGLAVVGYAQTPAVRSSTYFDSAQLLLDLKTLSADDMQGRQVETPGGAKARAYVTARLKESGVTPLGQSFDEPFTFTQRGRGGAAPSPERHGVNVVGTIKGTQAPDTYIIVSAHYDHLGVRNGVVMNGADDNASGTAGLFSVAKYFSTHPPAHSILFVAFDAEESGDRGSQAFAAAPPVPADRIAIDLNMDMIGRDPDPKLFVVGTYKQPFLKPFIDQIAAKAPVKVLTGHDDPTQKGVEDWTRDSDHYSFMQAKIPALYFGVEDFDQHHKATDDYETMSFDFYVGAVETMIQAVQVFDARLEELPARNGAAIATAVPQAPPLAQAVDVSSHGLTLHGTLLVPDGAAKRPVVLIIAGSGPTDRDGNSAVLPGHNDTYKMLASELAKSGIASLRYDKRAIGESKLAPGTKEDDLRFEDYVADAEAWIAKLRQDARFSSVIVAGHSEGSLIGIIAAREAKADAVVSIAGVAVNAADVLREQLRPQLAAAPALASASEAILKNLEQGKTTADVPPQLAALYRPSVQPYLISWIHYVPSSEIAKLTVPVLILQGTTDIQVPVSAAQALKAAKPDATLDIIDGMNHVLKIVPDDRARQIASYSDPSLPIAPELVSAVTAFVKKLGR